MQEKISFSASGFDAVIKIWEHITLRNPHIRVEYLNTTIMVMLFKMYTT